MLSLTGLAIIVGTIVLVQHLSLKPPHTHASIPPQEKPALPLPEHSVDRGVAVHQPERRSASRNISATASPTQLINDLSRLPGLFVIARNSSFTYKGKAVKEQEIGKRIGSEVRAGGQRAQKSPTRCESASSWSMRPPGRKCGRQRFDRPLKDIFAVQDEIVGRW